MGFLGWAPGVVLFFFGGAAALYCNVKLARLCIIDGKRYTRFRCARSACWPALHDCELGHTARRVPGPAWACVLSGSLPVWSAERCCAA